MYFWIIKYSAITSEIILCCAICLISYRVIIGPNLADRIAGLDFLSIILAIFALVLAIHYQTPYYWNIAFVICLLGFITSTIFTKFILQRKEKDK